MKPKLAPHPLERLAGFTVAEVTIQDLDNCGAADFLKVHPARTHCLFQRVPMDAELAADLDISQARLPLRQIGCLLRKLVEHVRHARPRRAV